METKCVYLYQYKTNVFVKPNEQSSSLLEYSAMARKRLLKTNIYIDSKKRTRALRSVVGNSQNFCADL